MSNESAASATRQRRDPTNCKICDAPAVYSYVGVVVCASCKMFFKRYAEADQSQWRCRTRGNCAIHIFQRPICSFCRMKKCLEMGMSVDFFRSGTSKKGQKKDAVAIRSPNLLQNDPSTLSRDQWAHLSNIVHCYDEYTYISFAQTFMEEQNRLPMKIRFRTPSVLGLIFKMATGGQCLFQSNGDFLALPPSDRSTLVRKTVKTVNGLHVAFIGNTNKLLEIPACRMTLEMMYGPVAAEACYRTGLRLDPDVVFVKLILSSLMFSTFHCTDFALDSSLNSHDIPAAVRIQDQYVDLAWRYMIHKYDFQRAVTSFSHLILSLLAFYQCLTQLSQVDEYNLMVADLVKSTEQVVLTNSSTHS